MPRSLLRTGPLLLPGRGLRSDQRRAEAQAGASIVRRIHACLTNPGGSGDRLLVLRTRSATVVGSVPGPAVWGLNAASASRCPLPSTTPRRPVPAEEGPLTSAEVHLDPSLPIFPSPTRPPAAVGTRQRAPSDWGRCLALSSLHSQQPNTDAMLTTQVYRRGSRSGVRPRLGNTAWEQREPGLPLRQHHPEGAGRSGPAHPNLSGLRFQRL